MIRGGLILIAALRASSAAPRRRRLGEKLDLQGLRRLADDGALGPNLLFKLDGESSFITKAAVACTAKAQQHRRLLGGPETGGQNCTAAAEDDLAERVADAICKSPAEHVFMIGGKYEARQRAAGLDLWYKCPASASEDSISASRESFAALEQFLDNVGAHGGVLEVDADQRLTASLVPNDSFYNSYQKGHYNAINLEAAWELSTGDPNVVVQMVDSGAQTDHPDLQANIWQNPGETDC